MTPRERKRKRQADLPGPAPVEGAAEELALWKDRALRALAESANVRRRAAEEVEERTRHRMEAVLLELIRLSESVDLALRSAPPEWARDEPARHFLDGVRAIQAGMVGLMDRQGLEAIQPAPEDPFDPECHEAAQVVEMEGLEGPRLEILRRGYRLGRRILRPAQVRLLRPVPPAPAPAGGGCPAEREPAPEAAGPDVAGPEGEARPPGPEPAEEAP